ncbi:MAG: phosphotransferase [Acidobacteria bacterium]|nr:phosphotransferase [Acidobacteriota bacterium]
MTTMPPASDPTVIDARSGTRVETAIDPHVMGDVFRRLLQTPERDIVGCRIARYRHRPGDRCLVQYAISVRDRAGVVTDEHVTGQWHHAPDRTPALYRKLARRAAGSDAAWTSPFAPVFFDASSGMLATTYPWDRRMPALPRIATGRAPELVAPMLAWMDAGSADLEGVRVERVRYREQLNAVCRYDVRVRREGGRTETARFYVKAYTDDGGARAAGLLAMLDAATPPSTGAARVRRAVAYVDDLRALILAEAPGTPLDRLPMDPRVIEPALRQVATALAWFGQRHAPLDALTPDTRRAASARARQAIDAALPSAAVALAAVQAAIAAAPLDAPPGLTHGDLKLEHVFLDRGRVQLIDVDSCRLADPLWDLALLQARWWAARDAEWSERALGDWGCGVLAAAYLARVPARDTAHLPVLQAMACVDVAAGLVKRRETAWADRAGRLVARARTLAEAPR